MGFLTSDITSEMTDEAPETDLPGGVNRLLEFRRWRLTGLGEDLLGGRRSLKKTDRKVRVMNYNLLAPVYAARHHHLYTGTDPRYTDWAWRWSRVQQELLSLQPHLVTLQEVQFSPPDYIFTRDIKPGLEKAGYDLVSQCRSGGKEDGCAIAFRRKEFSLEFSRTVEYNKGQLGILDKDNIALIVCLKSRVSGGRFLVATTHLLFSPRRHEVRLAQTVLLLAELDRLARQGGGVPVILTGDFNSLPGSESHSLLRHGQVEYDCSSLHTFLPPSLQVTDCCQFVGDEQEAESVSERDVIQSDRSDQAQPGRLTHRLGLRSVHRERGEVTTFHNGHWLTVDYIFYSTLPARRANCHTSDGRREGNLKLVGRLDLPSAQQMAIIGSLPNQFTPSDHLPLLADFLLVK